MILRRVTMLDPYAPNAASVLCPPRPHRGHASHDVVVN
jgi:hypothetical protein